MSTENEKIVKRAQERFRQASDFENENRINRLDDRRFLNGDQWPDYAKRDRERPGNERPMLVINRLPQYRNRIINEIRQNSPAIKIRPVDDKADIKTAEMLQGLIRHIEDYSNAGVAYDTAAEHAIDEGLGYIRILPEYMDDETFDQQIRIKRIVDPFKVYFDPQSVEPDGCDARFAFITEEIPREEFEREYEKADFSDWNLASTGDNDGWYTEDTVRIAEYFEIDYIEHTITSQDGRTRKAKKPHCMWYKIGGYTVLGSSEIPTRYIPVVPVLGNECWIEGRRDLYGLIRNAKDPQRQYNFIESAKTEYIGLSPKAPYILAAGQDEGYEPMWLAANQENYPYLVYNPVTIQGTLAPAPKREAPPMISSALVQAGIQTLDDMQATIGIYNPSLGQKSNEQSGTAIAQRQVQAEIGSFHYADNLGRSIRHVGVILIDMIPRIYDVPRIARILGEDGEPKTVEIDPRLPQAYAEMPGINGDIQRIYNPGVGKYDVVVSTGPSYQTKRQEAADGITNLVKAFPPLMQIAGDLLVKSQDWPDADIIAKRLRTQLPPAVLQADEDEKMNPLLASMQQQLAQANQLLQEANQHIGTLENKQAMEMQKIEIDRITAQIQLAQAQKDVADARVDGPTEKIEIEFSQKQNQIDRAMLELDKKAIELAKREQQVLGQAQKAEETRTLYDQSEAEMKELAEAINKLVALLAQSQSAQLTQIQQMHGMMASMAKPKRKMIEFDPQTGRPIGIVERDDDVSYN